MFNKVANGLPHHPTCNLSARFDLFPTVNASKLPWAATFLLELSVFSNIANWNLLDRSISNNHIVLARIFSTPYSPETTHISSHIQ